MKCVDKRDINRIQVDATPTGEMISEPASTSTPQDVTVPAFVPLNENHAASGDSSITTFTRSPETSSMDLLLHNFNDGRFPSLDLSASLEWSEDYLAGDHHTNLIGDPFSMFTLYHDPPHLSKAPSLHLVPCESLAPSQAPSVPPPSSTSSSNSPLLSGGINGDNSITTSNLFLGPSGLTFENSTELYQELFQMVREYPRKMLQRDFWSPFIHHRLYRCAKDGMAEPLGIALACISAHENLVESSSSFIDNMINTQREKLIRGFHLYSDRPETCLAALHAVNIYQILGLFDNPSVVPNNGDRWREKSGPGAEWHSSFLLKMTRRLCSMHQYAFRPDKETDWSRWRFAESLRRNVFLVNLINVLAAKSHKFHHDYFEPLDDAMILQMPLPATEQMWRACSERQWVACQEDARQLSSAPTLQKLLELDSSGNLDVSTLPPLTRIILACAKIYQESDWRGVT
ncbi:hypothetical protein PRK78_002412 [Emydomyces testavorans]|uniref:Transcription factor domain-containing protein n=1 Tax=Emydomyces testavorans TaxID=2070801 RepID=A0AAF0IHJ8_9EURO|nr:hypothetical protein PRK78_002412 [Emydomyces testavorans]